jgi:hypothetical protein
MEVFETFLLQVEKKMNTIYYLLVISSVSLA